MVFRRIFIAFVLVFVFAGLLYTFGPLVYAFVRYERLSRYIKIHTNYPRCAAEREPLGSLKCECEFTLEHATRPEDVVFEGSGFRKSYDPSSRTFSVSGTGIIDAGSNRIVFSQEKISINGVELPNNMPSWGYVLIQSDGKLTNTRIDLHW